MSFFFPLTATIGTRAQAFPFSDMGKIPIPWDPLAQFSNKQKKGHIFFSLEFLCSCQHSYKMAESCAHAKVTIVPSMRIKITK